MYNGVQAGGEGQKDGFLSGIRITSAMIFQLRLESGNILESEERREIWKNSINNFLHMSSLLWTEPACQVVWGYANWNLIHKDVERILS